MQRQHFARIPEAGTSLSKSSLLGRECYVILALRSRAGFATARACASSSRASRMVWTRWANRTKRQATSWSFTAITASRRLAKGILYNRLYVGKQLWNRSRWLKDPDTKKQEYRIRPKEEWVETEAPELRIVPQALWEKAHVRLVLQELGSQANPQRHVGKYLLSGFVRCAVCDGAFVKVNHAIDARLNAIAGTRSARIAAASR